MPDQRVVAYIDGFNLYYGLKSKGWRRYYWLDVHRLALRLLKPGQQLLHVKYFTSRVSATPTDPDKPKRQGRYLEALDTVGGLEIFYGHYLRKAIRCRTCGSTWEVHDEKMTDVNIAVHMLADAFRHVFDTALIISGDSDLSGLIQTVREMFPAKRVVVAFPPRRVSRELRRVATASFTIGRRNLAASQFPDSVRSVRGHDLRRPPTWR